MRECKKCGVTKDEEQGFYKYSKTGKYWSKCKKCANAEASAYAAADPEKAYARNKAWRAANPGKASAISRAWQLRHPEQFRAMQRKIRFNIDFEAMWEAQKGICASCNLPMQNHGKQMDSVVVDHDRSCCPGKKSCGKCVRGLIHWSCNVLMGYAKDNIVTLRAAADYLERWESRKPIPTPQEAPSTIDRYSDCEEDQNDPSKEP